MSTVVRASLILAAAVTLVSVIVIATGLHRNPLVGSLGYLLVVIAIDVGVVYWALRRTASDNTYGRQLINGVLIGLCGGFLIFLGSLLVTGVLFPDALDEAREGSRQFMQSAGMTAEQIEARIAATPQSPLGPAIQGWVGTLFTSSVAAAILAAFLRRR